MIARLALCLVVLAAGSVKADDLQLIPQLQSLAWMIGEWGPKSVKHNSPEIAIESMGQLLVLPSDDGDELTIRYGFITRHIESSHVIREEHEQIVSLDDHSKKLKVAGKVIYIYNGKIHKTDRYEFNIIDLETWATRIFADNRLRIQLGAPRLGIGLSRHQIEFIGRKVNSAPLTKDLEPLAWMIGQWEAEEWIAPDATEFVYVESEPMRVYASFDGKSIDIRYSYSFGVDMLPLPQRQSVKERITWNQERKAFQITVSSGEKWKFTGYLVQKGDGFQDEENFSIEKSGNDELCRTWPSMPIGEGYDGLASSRLSFKGTK